jgi:PH and SEC7 domain-containing protein
MLCRKQYWESSGKRAKAKTWMDVFVVIQKGELNMFTFGEHGGSGSGVVGGGNWLVGTFSPVVRSVSPTYKILHRTICLPSGQRSIRWHC